MEGITHKDLGRVSLFGDRGACYIGLTKPASITLLTYDLQVASAHLVCSTAHGAIKLCQRLPYWAVPVASDAELLPERTREAPRRANFMVRAYRAHNIMREHACIDADARSATRLGLPRELWD